jgi:hypothetical protein
MMDDLTLPAEYHIAVLDLTDAILATLAQVSSRHKLNLLKKWMGVRIHLPLD